MNNWSFTKYGPDSSYAAVGAITDQPVSKEFSITAKGALNMVIMVKVATVTNAGTQTLKLQTQLGDNTWVDSKSATFTAAGNVYIKLQAAVAGDQAYLPLLNRGRVVLTQTHANDRATIQEVHVLQEA